ncbi:MAG TPA: hypothetical protein VK327_04450 [Candidatus Paceibacterota bacterium]|nr:hypothetical protein [Candidatus Paceibacterota bacterium]
MNNPVQFRIAVSNSYPTGTGSYGYEGSFQFIVQNIAYAKMVSAWAKEGGTWKDIPASFVESLPDNRELWKAPATNRVDEFVARYTVEGQTYWDNNGGSNYPFPKAYDEFNCITGIDCPVILGSASLSPSGLRICVGIQNRTYDKVVGVVYTTDGWATTRVAYGSFYWEMTSGLEVWLVQVPLVSVSRVDLAVFGRFNHAGVWSEYWDNNFWRNYAVTPAAPVVTKLHAVARKAAEWFARGRKPVPPAPARVTTTSTWETERRTTTDEQETEPSGGRRGNRRRLVHH